jgi:hypothetical protein
MTTPTWTVRVAAGEAPTALIVERPDGALVTEADGAALYEQINGGPQPDEPDPDMPPGLSQGRCGDPEDHPAHVATIEGDDGGDVEFWCMGGAVPEPVAVEGGQG